MSDRDPYRNEYWDDKRVDFARIQVPAYVHPRELQCWCLHNPGAFRAFAEIQPGKKWSDRARPLRSPGC